MHPGIDPITICLRRAPADERRPNAVALMSRRDGDGHDIHALLFEDLVVPIGVVFTLDGFQALNLFWCFIFFRIAFIPFVHRRLVLL